jgi:two-component system CheB/CheR fusion protein
MARQNKKGSEKRVATGSLGNGAPTSETPAPSTASRDFPIVGIGASAGGLEAFEQFFSHADAHAGMAYVLVQHLDPSHKSILTELLKRYTSMPVYEIQDGMEVRPNSVYVIPPNRYLGILHGKLLLMETGKGPGVRTPIDFFFRALAEDQKERAICVVLSGTGAEGAMGLRAVKGVGGMTMVQTPESAKYDGMPRNALATGLADYTLAPEEMPAKLAEYVNLARLVGRSVLDKAQPASQGALDKIFMIIRRQTGHDFSLYKHSTIVRRAERRMAIHRIPRIDQYVKFLQDNPAEVETLFKELLIGVTGFFRDPEAWAALRERVMPRIISAGAADHPVRFWVPGCATGEEAYSVAILAREVMTELGKDVTAQIFATDIDAAAIDFARIGAYPESIGVDMSPERLERFFTKQDVSRRVKKDLRDMVVFALQSVIRDPPFSKIDLVCCRNLLIYLGGELQRKVMPLFHYALKQDGFLFLGSSETIGEFSDHFEVVDRKWKIFKRKDTDLSGLSAIEFPSPTLTDRRIPPHETQPPKPQPPDDYHEIARTMLFEPYCPTGIIIDQKGDIQFIHGRTGKYLEHVTGQFSGNIISMAREGIKRELAVAIRKAIPLKMDIRIDGLTVKTNGETQRVNLVVKPITDPPSARGAALIIFEDVPAEQTADPGGETEGDDPRIRRLQHELTATKEYLQATIEELQTSNEELTSSNEELQSTNEELQSANEELETSKEELQSVNEELTTVNFELQRKIDELSKISGDLNNLLAGAQIGTVFLDVNLCIQRFTPSATGFINLIATDVGRPISHIASNMYYDRLVDDAKEVLQTLIPKEIEVRTKDERWHTMRMLPYRTVENVIDGVVVTFFDITPLKALESKLKEAESDIERRIAEVNERLGQSELWVNTLLRAYDHAAVTVDHEGTILNMNPLAEEMFGYNKDEVVGRPLSLLCSDTERVEEFSWEANVALGGDRMVSRNMQGHAKSGETIPLQVQTTLVRDGEGRPIGMVQAFKAIAPRRRRRKKTPEQ